MWAKASQSLLLVAAAGLVGCAAMKSQSRLFGRPSFANAQDIAIFEEGVALAANLRFRSAEERFQQVLGRFLEAGDAKYASEAMFWLGYCREKQGRHQEATELYYRVIASYARSRAAELSQQRLSLSQAGQ